MRKFLLAIGAFFLLSLANISFASINLTVSPIKYEINSGTGVTIIKTAKLINYSDESYTIYTGKSDFTTTGNTGNPKFVRKSELVFQNQQLSEWITINTPQFIIGPKETKEITFSIEVPEDATPGGHYGAVFFKRPNSESSSGNALGINVDYGVLILLNVDGDIITDGDIDDLVVNSGGASTYIENIQKDNCLFGDYSDSEYDSICFNQENTSSGNELSNNEKISDENGELKEDNSINNNQVEKDENSEEKFQISFEIPFNNKGNTHLKPEGKIILTDEDGNEIKGVGKKIIKNERGVIIGEQIVDYIPINDIGGNVLPYSRRDFLAEWKGFPYKNYDDEGNQYIEYMSPGEHYTIENTKGNSFVNFWQRVLERNVNKKIKATLDISYKDKNGEDVELNSAKDFYITYKEKYLGINYYVVVPIIAILILIFLFLLFIIFKKKYRCKHCDKKISKDMKICPYCGKKQKHKKS